MRALNRFVITFDSYSDTATANNATFQLPNQFGLRTDEIIRIDYRINERHSLYGRYLHDDADNVDPFGTFILIGTNFGSLVTSTDPVTGVGTARNIQFGFKLVF